MYELMNSKKKWPLSLTFSFKTLFYDPLFKWMAVFVSSSFIYLLKVANKRNK